MSRSHHLPALLGGAPSLPEDAIPRWPQPPAGAAEKIAEIVRSGRWGRLHPDSHVERFEHAYAALHDASHGIAVCSGTAALELALRAVGVQPGDEVIVPALTFIASGSAVVTIGAFPVFVDCVPESLQIDADAVAAAVTPRTRAILAVNYGGYPADYDQLLPLARDRGIPLIQDCAHAQGGQWRGRGLPCFADVAAYSFQESKSLPAGEGGMLLTNDEEIGARARLMHNIGRPAEPVPGDSTMQILHTNRRMTEFQGALLGAALPEFQKQIERREEAGKWLGQALREQGVLLPLPADERITRRGYYFFVTRYQAASCGGLPRARFLEALQAEGVPCGAGYGCGINRHTAFSRQRLASLYPRGAELPDYPAQRFPVTDEICQREQVTFPHPVLLADSPVLEGIVAAVQKIREHADALVAREPEMAAV